MNKLEQSAELIFGQVLDLPRDRRPAFLDQACGTNLPLRRRVEDLLEENDRLTGFLSQSPLEAPKTADPSSIALETRLLDRYRILAVLGSGGMGVVYRARDQKLERDVAIKVLQPGLLAGLEGRERFRREARMLAKLNHSGIASVYDVIEHEGLDYIVMELVAGEPLSARLRNGQLSPAEATSIALQVAAALEEAHDQGVIHRDLKPANVMITSKGQVKVLDFGVAKLVSPGAPDPTLSLLDTRGIMGTPRYMSPEQALGKTLDNRSDLWSLGVLFYESLTGVAPFHGDSSLAILHAVTTDSFRPPHELCPGLPPLADRIVARALEKNRDLRYASANEMKADLQGLAGELARPHSTPVPNAAPTPLDPHGSRSATSKRSRWKLWSALSAGVLALGALAAVYFLRSASPGPLPDSRDWKQLTFFTDSAVYPALSPDGRMLTFIRGDNSFMTTGQVYVEFLPDGEPVQLTHDNTTKMSPAFSPDNANIAYSVVLPWDTWEVPVLGGEPHLLLPNSSSLTWIDGGKHLLFSEILEGMHMAVVTTDQARGNSRDVYVPQAERGMAHHSYLSPDGKWLLIVEMDSLGNLGPCRVVPFQGGAGGSQVGPPDHQCWSGAWSADGRWLYLDILTDSFHLWRQRFPGGVPQQITFGPTSQEGIAMAPDGKSLVTSVGTQDSTVWIHDKSGDHQISSEGYAISPSLSPDGRSLYFLMSTGETKGLELWVEDIAGGQVDRMLPGYVMQQFDVSRDGKQIVFSMTDDKGRSGLWIAPASRRSSPVRLTSSAVEDFPFFLPDGDIVFRAVEGKSDFLYRMKPDGSDRRKIAPQRIFDFLSISRDGRWLLATTTDPDENHPTATWAFPSSGGTPVKISVDISYIHWDTSGRYAFLYCPSLNPASFLFPVQQDTGLPKVPPGGLKTLTGVPDLKNVPSLPWQIESVVSPSVYAYSRQTTRRNLYRIPLQ